VSVEDRGRSQVGLGCRQNLARSLCCSLSLPNHVACSRGPHHVQTCTHGTQGKHESCLVGSLPLENDGGMWIRRPLSCMVFPRAAYAECLLAGSQYYSEIRVIATEDGVENAVSTDAAQPHWRLVLRVAL